MIGLACAGWCDIRQSERHNVKKAAVFNALQRDECQANCNADLVVMHIPMTGAMEVVMAWDVVVVIAMSDQ